MASQISRMAAWPASSARIGFFLGHLVGARFDHDDAVLAPGDDQIEAALLALREGRIDDVLAVDETDADAGDRLLERNARRAPARPRHR